MCAADRSRSAVSPCHRTAEPNLSFSRGPTAKCRRARPCGTLVFIQHVKRTQTNERPIAKSLAADASCGAKYHALKSQLQNIRRPDADSHDCMTATYITIAGAVRGVFNRSNSDKKLTLRGDSAGLCLTAERDARQRKVDSNRQERTALCV